MKRKSNFSAIVELITTVDRMTDCAIEAAAKGDEILQAYKDAHVHRVADDTLKDILGLVREISFNIKHCVDGVHSFLDQKDPA